MTGVTVGFVIGKAASMRQSPIYKAVLDFNTGVFISCIYFQTCSDEFVSNALSLNYLSLMSR